ncbi:pyridoxamine 5-phosphate oxidase [Nocardia sp. SYP-A9097]|uniref:pyridoxamine 5'-phosphate oxidase family protein n=1 Tax=Nocardia sp. SYP-A9097 TaxID=2663237 RepID=UPI00129BCE74|nr:pyridoxamine 5'-phosphate oxidase family protein [Nocardia sp. SYP-A9097]MRH91619.1 pyridoxamine 5-phosphate oxidase [Nocardia sp. SYP-A9097]
MPLPLEERQSFLAQPHIGALAVNKAGRAPLSVPIWYQYSPGGELWIITSPDSQKMQLLKESGRFSIMAQVLEPTVRYVTVEGPVTRIGPMSDEMHLEMASRYLTPDQVTRYLKYAEPIGVQVAVYMRPEHWLSADMGPL